MPNQALTKEDDTDLSLKSLLRELVIRVSRFKRPKEVVNDFITSISSKLSSTLAEYESNRKAGAEQTIRRYLTLTLWLVPVHAYLCYLFAVKSKTSVALLVGGGNWAGSFAEGNLNMLILTGSLVALCIWSSRRDLFLQSTSFLVSASYLLATMSFSYLSEEANAPVGFSGMGTVAFYVVLMLIAFLYRAPPYITIPMYSGVYVLMLGLSGFYDIGTLIPGITEVQAGSVIRRHAVDNFSLLGAFTAMVLSSVSWHTFSGKRVSRLKIEELKVELDRHKKELKELTEIDEVTGLKNRKTFWKIASRDYAKTARSVTGSSTLLLLSIDNLNILQKEYGNNSKEKILRGLARVMSRQLRTTDVAGRAKDDDLTLGIFLPETSKSGAVKVAQGLLEALRSSKILVVDPTTNSRVPVNLKLRVGIAEGNGVLPLSAMQEKAASSLMNLNAELTV